MTSQNQIQSIQFKRIKAGSLFKFIFIVTASIMIPFLILCGIAAFFGANTVTVNQKYVTGIWGLVSALIMAPIFSVVFAGITWLFAYISIRIIGKFKPFTISYVTDEKNGA
jgi:hypothetical protein